MQVADFHANGEWLVSTSAVGLGVRVTGFDENLTTRKFGIDDFLVEQVVLVSAFVDRVELEN